MRAVLRAARGSAAVRDAWQVFLLSRLAVLGVAVLATGALTFTFERGVREPPLGELLHPFGDWPLGGLLDTLLTPLARWDAIWYLSIAQDGYSPATLPDNPGSTTAFFPVYPTLVRVAGGFLGDGVAMVMALVVSLAAFFGALVVLHRLVSLELGERYARPVLLLVAFAPVAFYFSAPYTESLFLLLTVSAIYAARTGHWAWAGVLAALASGTRNTGFLLLVPLALLYLYGPRGDRETGAAGPGWRALLPRHRLRPDVLWIAAAPLGLVAFGAYLERYFDDPFAWRNAQAAFGRTEANVLPWETVWDGVEAAADGLDAWGAQFAFQNVLNLVVLALVLVGIAGALRRLPIAYGAYAAAAVLPPLTAPAELEPLRTMPRFALALFPVYMWLGWVIERRGITRPVVVASGALLAVTTAGFATWHPFL